ncbi:MAG: hypothetical protein DDT32_02258 [Syntrophomonadaceae bacterium]|nr:hypothetical protein [Bacillota bacterium]
MTAGGGPGGSTVTVKVAGPRGAPNNMVTGRGNTGTAPARVVVKPTGEMTPGAVIVPAVSGGNPTPVTVTVAPDSPPIGVRVMPGAVTVKGAVAETTPTVTVKVAGPKGASGSMVTVVDGITPTAVVTKPTGAMTPGAIMTPWVPIGTAGNVPVTVTAVPRAPAVGARVMVAAGGGVTLKNAVAETTPTVAVMVASPKGATPSMVTVGIGIAISPAAVVVKVTGVITPGAVMIP